MALLRAYFDASHIEDGKGYVTTIAGYLGSEETWKTVETAWNDNLKMWSLDRFHLTEILAGRCGVSDADLCVLTFARIIYKSNLCAIHSSVREDDWYAAEESPEYAERFPTHYHYCASGLFHILLEHMKLEHPADQVAVIFDHDIDPEAALDAIVKEYRSTKDQFAALAMGRRRDHPLIDCADLCAGQERIDFLAREFPQHRKYCGRLQAMNRHGRGVYWSFQTDKIVEEARAEIARRKKESGGP